MIISVTGGQLMYQQSVKVKYCMIFYSTESVISNSVWFPYSITQMLFCVIHS